jgi:predicted outer membrane repeat protein
MRWPAFLGFAVVLTLAHAVIARTWYITPDGTGDAPNIQDGIDSATAGDTVLVGSGIYYESGIHMRSGAVLLGETAEGDSAIIDAEEENSVLYCRECDATTIIEGLTIRNGKLEDWYPTVGGGPLLASCYLTIRRCVFSENKATYGGAVHGDGGRVVFEDCIFVKNYAGWEGIRCPAAMPAPLCLGAATYTAMLTVTGWDASRISMG